MKIFKLDDSVSTNEVIGGKFVPSIVQAREPAVEILPRKEITWKHGLDSECAIGCAGWWNIWSGSGILEL